jgi:hypothetical protein
MFPGVAVGGVIGDDDVALTELDVRLDDHDPGLDLGERLPDPEIITINIDAEQVDFSGQSGLGDHWVDVFGRDVGLAAQRGMEFGVGMPGKTRRRFGHVGGVAVDEESGKTEIQQKIGAIAVQAVARADVHAAPASEAEDRENEKQPAVIIGTAEDTHAGVIKRWSFAAGDRGAVLVKESELGGFGHRRGTRPVGLVARGKNPVEQLAQEGFERGHGGRKR